MRVYRLKESDLGTLRVLELENPHYKSGPAMLLYLHRQVRELAKSRYGGVEPYRVTLVPFTDAQLRWFEKDPERLKSMSPATFQRLVADRIDAMGLEVQFVGGVYQKDGGVDLIAYPKPRLCKFPFLLAVQAKHHGGDAKTGPDVVRDLHGVITSRGHPFNAGMLVTNTAFTPDAQWFARHNSALLRLRDVNDLQRWLRDDFENENEWREVPETIELAPGVTIAIPRPKLFLPDDVE